MNNTKNAYCRLCAKLKPLNKLTDLQTEPEMCGEYETKLMRLSCQLDLKDDSLPKTVCLICTESLKHAFDFIMAVDKAQAVLNGINLSQTIKKEVEHSDSENFDNEPIEEKNDTVSVKLELVSEESSSKSETRITSKKSSKFKCKKDPWGLDAIPLSQLKLSWKDYSWMCAYCGTQFADITELRNHSMEYHKTCNAYRCTDCNIRKLRLDKFLTHVRRHKKYLKLSCHECFERFQSTNETNKHRSAHLSSKFVCLGCNTNFASLDEHKTHASTFFKYRQRSIQVGTQKDNLTCILCKKKYKTRTSLNTHMKIHTDRQRDHTCEVCGKCYLNKQTLAKHLESHDDLKPFQCKICKCSFRAKNLLRKHVGIHDGEKPFSCEQCGKSFRLQRQLTSHSIIHTDSLPHVCSYCNKGFRFKTILNQHVRQHTGVKPYSCDICHRDFTNWPNYNKHMKRRHNMDMAKKKHTPDGVFPLDPATGQVVYPEMDEMEAWKKTILTQNKRGRPRLQDNVDVQIITM